MLTLPYYLGMPTASCSIPFRPMRGRFYEATFRFQLFRLHENVYCLRLHAFGRLEQLASPSAYVGFDSRTKVPRSVFIEGASVFINEETINTI